MKSAKKLIIILNDVWNKFSLEDVGIVFESDDAKGSKILLASRFEWVLGSDMGVDENFAIELLSPNETWDWFHKIMGDDLVKDNEFWCLGKEIINEHGCLLVVIKIISLEMKGRDLSF